MAELVPFDDLPTWRRLAISAWGKPADPSVYGAMDIDAVNVLSFLAEARARTGIKLTLTHVMAKAGGIILTEYPEVNAVVRFGKLYLRKSVDVTVIVALGGGHNLTSAKLRGVERKSLVEIGFELERRATMARSAGQDSLDRFMRGFPSILVRPLLRFIQWLSVDLGLDFPRLGISSDPYGSAMLSNVGSFGLTQAYAALLPFARTPVVVTLGAIHDKPVARDGAVVVRPTFVLAGTFDHRVVDAFHIARLANRAKEILEDPMRWIGLPDAEEAEKLRASVGS